MKDAFNMIGIINLSFFFVPRVFITQLFYILIFLESIKKCITDILAINRNYPSIKRRYLTGFFLLSISERVSQHLYQVSPLSRRPNSNLVLQTDSL